MESTKPSSYRNEAETKRPRRILFASHESGVNGGATRSLLELALALAREPTVEPVVAVPEPGPLAEALAPAVRCVVVPSPRWTPYDLVDGNGVRPGFDPIDVARRARVAARLGAALPRWVRAVHTEQPDVVVTSTATIPVPALASACVRTPHVWWLQELVLRTHGLEYAFGRAASQRLIGWLSARVIANSSAVASYNAQRIRRDKLRVVHIGVPSFTVPPNRIDAGTIRLLVLGRQQEGKGTEVALHAVAELAARGTNAELRVVGAALPEFRDHLGRLVGALGVADRVQMLEHAPDPTGHLAWCNALLMCSEGEAFGRVTVEALKAGRPVVACRSGGTVEVVRDGVDGMLYPPGAVDALVGAVEHLSAPDVLARMSEAARCGNRTRFTMAQEVAGFLEVVAEVAAR